MFKKFKDKLAEEMKQSPARLQASMQHLAQVVSPALSNTSIQDISANDNFSLTEETDETPKNSPARHGFQNVELTSPSAQSTASRRSSLNSVMSDASFSLPAYETHGNSYYLDQSDMESTSDLDDSMTTHLDRLTKDQLYSAYRKMQSKYHKYHGRFTDLASHYKDMERSKANLEAILVKSQDVALKRISDLKEQCHLEQQAKAHLEEALRNDIEEKDHVINTLNTKIKLIQEKGPVTADNLTNPEAGDQNQEQAVEMLVDLSVPEMNLAENSELSSENGRLKDKVQKMEAFLQKYKEMLKRSKEKIAELMEEKNAVDRDFDIFKKSNAEQLESIQKNARAAQEEVLVLKEEIDILKKREEESVISLAENKLSIHQELDVKEEQIKKLRLELNQAVELKEMLSDTVEKYRTELETLKILNNTNVESERKKSEAMKKMQADMQQKLIDLEEKMGIKYHEEVNKNKELAHRLEELEKKESESVDKLKKDLMEMENKEKLVQSLLDEQKSHAEILSRKLEDLELICAELQVANASQKEQYQIDSNIKDTNIEELRQLLSDKDSKIEEYLSELQRFEQNIEAQNKELQILKSNTNDEDERNRFKNELINVNSQIESSQNEIDFLKNQKKTLIDALNNCKLAVQSIRHDYINLKQRISSNIIEEKNAIDKSVKVALDFLPQFCDKERIIENLTKKCSSAEISVNELSDKFFAVDSQNTKLVAEIENLKLKIVDFERLCKEKDEKLENLDDVTKKYQEALKDVEALKSENADHGVLISEIQSLKTELSDEKENSIKKDNELKNLLIKYNEEQQQCTNLRMSVDTYVVHSKALNSQNEKLTAELEESKQLQKKTLNTKTGLIEKLKTLREKLDKLANEKESQINSLLETLKTSEDTWTESLKTMSDENLALKDQISSLSEKVFNLETEISVKVCELADYKSQFDAAIKESEEMRQGRGEMNKLNENLDHATISLKEKLQDLEKINKETHEENSNLWQQLEVYKNQLCDVKSNVDIYREKYEEVSLRNTELTSRLNEVDANGAKDRAELKNLISQNQSHNLEIEKEKAIRRELEQSIDVLTKELDFATAKLLNADTESNKLLADMNEKSNLLKSQVTVNSDIRKRLSETESEIEMLRSKNTQLEERLAESETLNFKNASTIEEISKLNKNMEENRTELNRRKAAFDNELEEKDTEIKLLKETNNELKKQVDGLMNSVTKNENLVQEIELLKLSLEKSKAQINGYKEEVVSLQQKSNDLEEELKNSSKSTVEEISGNIEELTKEKLKLESHLDEALLTFQAKESQMQAVNEDLRCQVNKLQGQMNVNEEEQSLRIKQLVKEFQAQLHDKEEELQAALEKRFDQRQNFESNMIHQYKEQLKDFQIELTTKSEQIENLILSNEATKKKYQEEIDKLVQISDKNRQEHANELQEIDRRWKNTVKQKEHQLETKHEHEITELTKEWQIERRSIEKTEGLDEELESTSRVAMAAVQSNTGSFQTLQHTVLSQRKELAELRKLVKLRHDTVEDSTEIEYLRNILYEYMMGKETIVLARVIAAVVKFDQDQTSKVLKKEEDKLSLLGSLGLT